MNKMRLALVMLIFPLVLFSQVRKNQRLAEITYKSLKATIENPAPEERDGMIKALTGVIEMAEDEKFIKKVEAEIQALEKLIGFSKPKADLSKLTDSLVQSKNMVFEKVEKVYYIEPNSNFQEVMLKNPSGLYLFLYIDEIKRLSLELVHYTSGDQILNLQKAKLKVGEQDFEYELLNAKVRKSGLESCSLKSNSDQFIQMYQALSEHDGPVILEYSGQNGTRSATLTPGMVEEIKGAFSLYQELQFKNEHPLD